MFLGTFTTSFSGRHRVILPKKLRIQLEDNRVVLSKGLDRCIWGFDKKGFEEEAKKQLEVPLTEELGRSLRRSFFSQVQEQEIDSQGRFIIPDELIEFAGIRESVLIVGAGDHFEIWNPEKLI